MQRALLAFAVVAVTLVSLRAGASMEAGLDYFSDASAAIDAIVRRDLDDFFANQPLMGGFSLLLRAPFVAAVFHSSLETVYFAGALPCLLATVVLGLALARVAAERGQPALVQGLVAGLATINPITFRALHWGHPEELLGAALCVGAVLAALRERELLAGVLLGLAIATKQWALIAVLPVLLAAPARRLPLLAIAGGLVALFYLPALVADSARFGEAGQAVAGQDGAGASTTPWSLWWPIAEIGDSPLGERYMAPGWVGTLSHPLIVLLPIPLAALLWRRRDRRPDDALLLLALLFLLRCLLDNWNNDYYHAPFFVSLLAWETLRRPGVPYLSLIVAILLGLSFWPEQTRVFADSLDAAPLLFAVYVAWAVPLALLLATALYRPDILRQYHRPHGAAPSHPAVRGRPRRGGDRQLDRTSA
ncbi:MAG TPA: glycosyltransferase 87 family protein [Solirubrobacteraceae bacterium]|nr:glycosyltransferase 87 family protein [Solirubrobacteraceae bacterium]